MDGGAPNLVIAVDRLSDYTFGGLVYFFWKSLAVSGYMIGVNPFDQPGVEVYKKNIFALLAKEEWLTVLRQVHIIPIPPMAISPAPSIQEQPLPAVSGRKQPTLLSTHGLLLTNISPPHICEPASNCPALLGSTLGSVCGEVIQYVAPRHA